MRKKLLLTAFAVLTCLGISAQSIGDIVRTETGSYQITGANLITNGDFSNGLSGWKGVEGLPLAADSFTVVANGGPVNDGPYLKKSVGTNSKVASAGGILNAWQAPSGKTLIFSYYTKDEVAPSAYNGYEYVYQNTNGSADKTTETLYDPIKNEVSYSNKWKQVSYAFTGSSYLTIHFYWLNSGTDFANFFLGEAKEVANTQGLQDEIDIATSYYNNADMANTKEDLNNAITIAKADLTNSDITAVATAIETLKTAVANFIKANSVDITSRMTNADFAKKAMTGWTINAGGWNINTKATYTSTSGNTVNLFGEAWTASGGKLSNGDVSQTLTNLPAGKYRITADVNACQQGNASLLVSGLKLYANNDSVACATGNGIFSPFAVETTIQDLGSIKLGLNIKNTDGNWIAYDNVKLSFIGDTAKFNKEINNISVVIAQKALKVMIDSAKTVYGWANYPLSKVTLNDSINSESAFLTSDNLTYLANALNYMRSAINNYYADNKLLFALQDEIKKAQTLYDDATYKKGKEDLNTAIQTASQFLTSQDVIAIAQADTTLQKAETAFGIVNASYAHPINLCTNGTMSSMTGWTVLNGGTANPALHINTSGSAGANISKPFMECWVSSSTTTPGVYGQANYAYQELKDMPAGLYILKAAVNACNQGYAVPSAITGISLFMNVNDEPHSVNCATANGVSQYFTVEIEAASSSNLKYGLNIDAATTANWIAWDNVSLQFVGDPATYRKDSIQSTLKLYSDSLTKEIAAANLLHQSVTNPNDVDMTPFEDAIAAATNVLNEAITAEEYNQAITDLKEAEINFKASGVYPPEGQYFDMTNLIKDPTVATEGISAWTSDNTALTASPRQGTWWHALKENVHQTIQGLPNGDYVLTVKAWYRPGLPSTLNQAWCDTVTNRCRLYVNQDTIKTLNIGYDPAIIPLLEQLSSKYSLSKFDLAHCGACMDTLYNHGFYKNNISFNMSDENAGEATIGICVNEPITVGNFGGWCDFELKFYGKNTNGINPIVTDNKKTSVNNNNVYSITGSLVRSNAKNLEGLPKGMYIVNGKKFVVK